MGLPVVHMPLVRDCVPARTPLWYDGAEFLPGYVGTFNWGVAGMQYPEGRFIPPERGAFYMFGPEWFGTLKIICEDAFGREIALSKEEWELGKYLGFGDWKWNTKFGEYRVHAQSRVELHVCCIRNNSLTPSNRS